MNILKLSFYQITFCFALLCITTQTTPMMVGYGSYDYYKHLCQRAHVNTSRISHTTDCLVYKDRNERALLNAAENNEIYRLKQLIKDKVYINAKDPETGNTALHYAAHNGHISIGKILLANEANVNIRNKDGSTPLHRAIEALLNGDRYEEIVEFIDLLLNKKALINIENNAQNRPDNYLTITVGGTPPNEIDDNLYATMLKLCIDENKPYNFENLPTNTIKQDTDAKKIICLNRVHNLLLCARLETPHLTTIKDLSLKY